MWTSCLSDHQRCGRPSASETEHVVIAIVVSPRSTFSCEILFFVCFLFLIHFLPHGLSAQSSEVRFSLWTAAGRVGGAGLKRAAVAVQWLPHQSTPDQSSQQASHHKKHCGGCSDSQDGVPTYLTLLALWDASSDNQHQTTATITIIPMKGMERTGCSDGWMNL